MFVKGQYRLLRKLFAIYWSNLFYRSLAAPYLYVNIYILLSLFPSSYTPLKCILTSGFSCIRLMPGNLVVDRLLVMLVILLFFGDALPWNRMPGWIYFSNILDRYSWFNAFDGVGVQSMILLSLAVRYFDVKILIGALYWFWNHWWTSEE